jgi:two-component system sensor histidine kinase HydH
MMGGYLIHYELKEDQLFGRNAFAFAMFALWLAGAAAAILIVRKTLRKNALYREELRNQKELVALGTAARTLAHEIKNPLSAIRLQTDLISRLAPGRRTGNWRSSPRRPAASAPGGPHRGFLREPAGVPERLLLAEFAERTWSGRAPGESPSRPD